MMPVKQGKFFVSILQFPKFSRISQILANFLWPTPGEGAGAAAGAGARGENQFSEGEARAWGQDHGAPGDHDHFLWDFFSDACSWFQDLLDRSGDEEQVAKLKKDLKRTKALLKDAQMMIEKSQNEGTSKVIMRQLKNQVGSSWIDKSETNPNIKQLVRNRVGGITWGKSSNAHCFDKFEQIANKSVGHQSEFEKVIFQEHFSKSPGVVLHNK